MYAIGGGQHRNVGTIVHDHESAGLACAGNEVPAHLQQGAAWCVLTSNLDKAGAAREIRVGERWHRPSRSASHLVVDDGVQTGEVQTASARFLSLSVTGANRSMNFVL